MSLRQFPLLTDENINPGVVSYLRQLGFDVVDVVEEGWHGRTDTEILNEAQRLGRVLITHDRGIGIHTLPDGGSKVSIVRLHPGHIVPEYTFAMIDELCRNSPDVRPPFLIIVKRTNSGITIRTRTP